MLVSCDRKNCKYLLFSFCNCCTIEIDNLGYCLNFEAKEESAE